MNGIIIVLKDKIYLIARNIIIEFALNASQIQHKSSLYIKDNAIYVLINVKYVFHLYKILHKLNVLALIFKLIILISFQIELKSKGKIM